MLSPEWCDVRPCGQVLQRNAQSLVEEALREVPPSDLKQVLSLRMEPQLIRSLRRIASERGTTVSELLRAAASGIVSDASVPTVVTYRTVPQSARKGRTSPATGHSRGDHITPSSSPTRGTGYVETA